MKFVDTYIVYPWNFIFNHQVSPLRNIPDIALRHSALQALGLMWVAACSTALGSYTFFAVSLIGHIVLIAAAAVTIATLTVAAKKPSLFYRLSSREISGEHY